MWFIPCQFPSLLLSLFQYKIHVFHHGHIQIIKRNYTQFCVNYNPFRDSTLFLKHVSSLCGKGENVCGHSWAGRTCFRSIKIKHELNAVNRGMLTLINKSCPS